MLNFPTWFKQKQIKQYYSCSIPYETISSQDQLVLSPVHSSKLFIFFNY